MVVEAALSQCVIEVFEFMATSASRIANNTNMYESKEAVGLQFAVEINSLLRFLRANQRV